MRVCKIMFWLYVLPYNNCPLISCSVANGQTSLTVSSACKLKNAINADEVNAVEINDIFLYWKNWRAWVGKGITIQVRLNYWQSDIPWSLHNPCEWVVHVHFLSLLSLYYFFLVGFLFLSLLDPPYDFVILTQWEIGPLLTVCLNVCVIQS